MRFVNLDEMFLSLSNITNKKHLELEKNYIHFCNPIMIKLLDGKGLRKGHYIHIAGPSDSGKTFFVKNILSENKDLSVLYISHKQDDCIKLGSCNNIHLYLNNIFENIIEYLKEIPKGLIDIVVIDGINNMCCRDEIERGFKLGSTQKDEFQKFLIELRTQLARIDCIGIIINGINQMTNKAKYGYIIDNNSDLSLIIKNTSRTELMDKTILKVVKNLYVQNIEDLECILRRDI